MPVPIVLFSPGKVSGYNIFTKFKVRQLAAQSDVDAKDRMKVVGSTWRNLTAAEKEKVAY
jgi:hypothetical protein